VPLPTAKGLDHYAFACPRLDDAVTFFSEVLGGQMVMEHVLQPEVGTWMRDQLGVDERATARLAQLRLGPVTNVELWEYQAPGRREIPPRLWDWGGHHLAFYVDDLDAAVAYLEDQEGVTVLGTPVTVESGPDAEERWIYFQSPWGLMMELVSTPAAMPYEASTSARRFGPAPAWGHPVHIPTARNVDHLGITVPSLSAAVDFCTTYLDADYLYTADPVQLDDRYSKEHLGAECRGTVRRSMLRLGPTTNLELVKFDGPDRAGPPPLNSDVGGHHIALAVVDVDAAARYLGRAPGMQVLGVSQKVLDGEVAGDHWQYLRTPWGTYLEVLNMPKGVPLGRDHTAYRYEHA
jgi:catechol 2,3-dioxygenase-like lactoylglutathione lyase family enzyme